MGKRHANSPWNKGPFCAGKKAKTGWRAGKAKPAAPIGSAPATPAASAGLPDPEPPR